MFEEFINQLRQHHSDQLAEKFRGSAQESVRLIPSSTTTSPQPIGTSRLGGWPDLPINSSWPYQDDNPMSFLAQINFSELQQSAPCKKLPSSGLLFFFYNEFSGVWGFNPDDHSSWKVMYHEESFDKLKRTQPPQHPGKPNELLEFNCSPLLFDNELTYPKGDDLFLEKLQLTNEEMISYDKIEDEFFPIDFENPINRILGHPDLIQGDIRLECEEVTFRKHRGIMGFLRKLLPDTSKEDAAKLDLLLQIDSDDKPGGMCWGDCGRLYFLIHRDDLLQKNFDKTWMILQCY